MGLIVQLRPQRPGAARVPLPGRRTGGLGLGRAPTRDLFSVWSVVRALTAVAAKPWPKGSSVVLVFISHNAKIA